MQCNNKADVLCRVVDYAGNVCTAARGKKRKSRSDVFKQRFRKNFSALLEEVVRKNDLEMQVVINE